MTNSNYTKIFSGDFIIVKRIVFDLEHQNISVIIKDETESGRLAGFGAAIQGLQEIYVHNDELEKAKSIIESLNLEIDS